jgi:DNA-binding Lrp family transcriptional regulator
MSQTLTDKDEQLLALLRVNAREPVAALARKLGISRSTVQDRLQRLEERGVIAGYEVKLAQAVNQTGLQAFVTLQVEPRMIAEVGRAIAKLPEVEALFSVSGKIDLVALVRAATAEALDKLLDRIAEMRGIINTESSVVLSTKVERR